MRSTLSPTFAGSEMRHVRHMLNLVVEISNDDMNELSGSIKAERFIEFKDLTDKYSIDVIACLRTHHQLTRQSR